MRFDTPFIKLPIQFDAETLEREVRALPDSSWVPHPTGFVGNEAVRLVTVNGQPRDDFEGPMRPAADLARLPYVQQVMAELDGVWSRSRLMGLGPGAEVPEHVDSHYHWRTHIRIHVPVITNPKVLFTCGGETIHMAAGECWLFDSFRFHRVENNWTERRVHLVLDTVMTDSLHALIEAARNGTAPKRVEPGSKGIPRSMRFEQVNASPIMSPWEIRCHLAYIFEHAVDHPRLAEVRQRLERFADAWAAAWAQFGPSYQGVPTYRRLIAETRPEIERMAGDGIALGNTVLLMTVLDQLIFGPALSDQLTRGSVTTNVPRERLAS
jgi:hypothetical protein